jgi:hypothetical protein
MIAVANPLQVIKKEIHIKNIALDLLYVLGH